MDPINNETMHTAVQLVGPAGFGLLLCCGMLFYFLKELWTELKNSREKHIASLDLNTKALNDMATLIKERM